MRKLSTLVIATGVIWLAVGGTTWATKPEDPGPPEKVTICHVAGRADDPANYITLTLPWVAVYGEAGHFYENGTPRAGHEEDSLGECKPPETTTTTTTEKPNEPPETTTTTTVYVPPFNPPPVITTTTAPPETTTTVPETTTTVPETTTTVPEVTTTTTPPPPVTTTPPPPPPPPNQPRLPDTGGESWWIAAIGGILGTVGFGLRRLSRL